MIDYFRRLRCVTVSTWQGTRSVTSRKIPFYALKLVTDGAGVFGCGGDAPHRLAAPALFWQQPGVVYTWGPAPAGWTIQYVQFDGPRARELVRDGFAGLAPAGYVRLPSAAPLQGLFQQLAGIHDRPGPLASAYLLLRLEEILLAVQRQQCGREERGSRLAPVLARLHAEPAHAFDFPAEAGALSLSYSHFRRLFREATGAAPQEYLIRCRIKAAADLLLGSAAAVKQVASRVGYPDVAYFGRLFKKRTGLSPQAYRQEHRLA